MWLPHYDGEYDCIISTSNFPSYLQSLQKSLFHPRMDALFMSCSGKTYATQSYYFSSIFSLTFPLFLSSIDIFVMNAIVKMLTVCFNYSLAHAAHFFFIIILILSNWIMQALTSVIHFTSKRCKSFFILISF